MLTSEKLHEIGRRLAVIDSRLELLSLPGPGAAKGVLDAVRLHRERTALRAELVEDTR